MTQSQIAPDVAPLVRRARGGDAAATGELIAEHLPLVYNIVGRALAGHPDVDDVVQETMLRALRALPALREPERFRSWLVAIAYRQIQLHLRARRTSRLKLVPEQADVPDPAGDFAERTTAELVLDGQRRDLVEAARWLDADDRRLLGLWWQEAAGELSRAELADALGVRPKHAAVRVQRMKAQLDAVRGVVGALHARPRCPELAGLVRRWDGIADPLWRKRLVRHVRECPHCTDRSRGLIAPEELLLGAAMLPVPATLTAKVSALTVTGNAVLHHKVLAACGTAAVLATGGGIVYAVHYSPAPPPPAVAVAPPAPVLTTTPRPARPSSAAPVPGRGQAAQIYVAPGGSDDGDGSADRPFATLGKAVATVRPGQTIAMRGGTYRPAAGVEITTSGTPGKRITLTNYRGERPVIDASAVPADQWAVTQRASYWTVQGLTITGSASHAYVCSGCQGSTFRHLTMRGNARSGLQLRDAGTSGNQVLDSDFTGGAGTGLSIQFGSGTGNVVRGNRFAGNALAGVDLGAFGSPVTLEYNWAYGNGGSGFVLGGGTPPAAAAHRLRHNAAWSNGSHGFSDEGNTAALDLTNNTAWRNEDTGFHLPSAPATVRADVAVANGTPFELSAAATESRSSTSATFRSTDPAQAAGPRPASGTLPATAFLQTGTGTGASMAGG
ncbi:sigma-70 family RNA polymerase sigma factor [Actinoplanes sp. RD1]|uniref:sigma-70 family RNA polymerase sigma factor n=1 Tax=Actinoplanes sp. RD1 TaxID=3064538 RepID=UPI002741DE1C|nr:sigma-70 family RNA polymerase sigma factor [Actinoplanes sp. RD1]